MKTLMALAYEHEHRKHCFLCHPSVEHALPDLCCWHYWLFQFRLFCFLVRTRQLNNGRWKP